MKENIEVITDVCLDFKNHPFITCWESVIPNLWYNDELEYSFMLTSTGFRICKGKTKTEYMNWITQKEEFKPNKDLRKVIEEVIMNSNISEQDRGPKIYMSPKQKEMFDKAMKEYIKNGEWRNI